VGECDGVGVAFELCGAVSWGLRERGRKWSRGWKKITNGERVRKTINSGLV